MLPLQVFRIFCRRERQIKRAVSERASLEKQGAENQVQSLFAERFFQALSVESTTRNFIGWMSLIIVGFRVSGSSRNISRKWLAKTCALASFGRSRCCVSLAIIG